MTSNSSARANTRSSMRSDGRADPAARSSRSAAGAHGDQLGPRPRVAAREQRHVVAELDQLLGQKCDDPLGAAVQLGRHAFVQG